jgi:polyisoprenoid-binding protein YceI
MKMKMKLLSLAMILGFGAVSCNQNANTEGEGQADSTLVGAPVAYTINPAESKVDWKGSMLGVYDHSGTINLNQGSLNVAGGVITSGSFTVDMNTIVATDPDANYKMAPREKLIEHLMSDDFFAVATNPTATFTVKSVEGNTLKGDLSIRGISSEETVTDVVVSEADGKVSATGKLVFDRKKYNVNYENKMGNMVLSKDIELSINLNGVKQ